MGQVDREPSFRRACTHDVPAIVALVQSSYRGEISRQGWTTEADLLDGQRTDADEVLAAIRASDARILLALGADALLGSLLLAHDAQAVHLGMFAVRPDTQGRGIGRALLTEAERIVRAERLGTRIELSVIAQRELLIAWYVRCGYRVTERTQPFPYGDPRFGLPRRPDLYFKVLEKDL